MKSLFFLLVLLYSVESFAKQDQLLFIENKGQVTDQYYNLRDDISFVLHGKGLNIFSSSNAIHYQFYRSEKDNNAEPGKHARNDNSKLETYRLDVHLLGANGNAVFETGEQQEYYEQYYTSQFDEHGSITRSFQKITYKNVYQNIDWVFYSKNGSVKHEFIVREGGNPEDIKIRYEGASALQVLEDGSFIAKTPMGTIQEHPPVCFDSKGKTITSSFTMNDNILSFSLGNYSGDIVIDPTLEWLYTNGGTGFDDVSGIDVDGQGNIYLTGENEGYNIATTGAYQGSFSGIKDGYVVKLDNSGNILWGTFFGGPEVDQPFEAVWDNNGAVYIYGLTKSSSGIASPGAHQTTRTGGDVNGPFDDAFLAKFSPTGTRLWSTYYGGSGVEKWGNIDCDNAGNVYMSGGTNSTTGISTSGSHQEGLGGPGVVNGFLVKFAPSGTRVWGTYYGGPGMTTKQDYARGVTCDNSSNVYICGVANSDVNISTPGSFQENKQSSDIGGDGFIAKFNSDGVRQWGTYFRDLTAVQSLACDLWGNVFAAGNTSNTTDISTPNAYQFSHGGGSVSDPITLVDGFIAKFDALGNRLWSTYIGGNSQEYLEQILCDNLNYVYVMGLTQSTSGLATTNAYQPTYNGGSDDGFFARFNENGVCMWSSYFGDNNTDACYDIAIENSNIFYMSGITYLTNQLNSEAFVAKFQDNSTTVEEINNVKDEIAVFPNPTNGDFILQSPLFKSVDDVIDISIIDICGKTVANFTETPDSDIVKVKLGSGLSKGVYIVKIHSNDKVLATVIALN